MTDDDDVVVVTSVPTVIESDGRCPSSQQCVVVSSTSTSTSTTPTSTNIDETTTATTTTTTTTTSSVSDGSPTASSSFGSRETSFVDLKALVVDGCIVHDDVIKSNDEILTVNATTSTASSSTATSTSTLTSTATTTSDLTSKSKKQTTLEERGKVPFGLYVVAFSILIAQYVGDVWSIQTILNWKESMVHALLTTYESLLYLNNLLHTVATSVLRTVAFTINANCSNNSNKTDTTAATLTAIDWTEVAYALVVTTMIGSTLYVLIGAPFKAGFWTGPRSSKHRVHRYMGMAYLIQYYAVWVEFVTNYDHAKDSYLPHFIAINGLIQGYSAYFSFKVLPDLNDPGYYSDRAVASRKFIHENIYFSWLTTWGSIYYHEGWRNKLQSNPLGQLLEVVFIFYPYIVVRPLFPTTSFGAAGTGRKSRTEHNEMFYQYGTLAIKFFYLWAKYYLGFFVNFLWLLHKMTENETKLIKGMFTLNLGTISIAIFLHTLRFKGVLPAKLTFSIYLLQIYANFTAIPLAYDLFASHKMLCGTMLVGIMANMTRSRFVHFIWCSVMLYLIKYRTDIDW